MNFPYLSTIVFLPLVGAILIVLLGGGREKLVRYLSVVFTAIPLVLAFSSLKIQMHPETDLQ